MNTLSIIKKPVCKFSCLDVHLLEIVFYTFKLNFCFLQRNLTSHLNCPPHLFVGSSFCSLKNRFFFSPLMYLWSFFSTLVVLGSRSEKKKKMPQVSLFGSQGIKKKILLPFWTSVFFIGNQLFKPSISIIYITLLFGYIKEGINRSSLWFQWPDKKSY